MITEKMRLSSFIKNTLNIRGQWVMANYGMMYAIGAYLQNRTQLEFAIN